MKLKRTPLLMVMAIIAFSCTDTTDELVQLKDPAPRFIDISEYTSSRTNGRIENENYAVLMAEYITTGDSEEMGNIVFFRNVGNKQLAGDFVPALALDGTSDISYYVDENRPSADLTVSTSTNAIDRAMTTWDNVVCSNLGMTQTAFDGRPTGFISALFGFGGSFSYVSDVTHCGWLPGSFFNILAPGGSGFILGVTFTIVFTDGSGNLIDTDNNGKFDVAWREIYYNDNFLWNDGSTFDVETIALHEAGHGLSQAHFGAAFRSGGNLKLHFSPRAVMNAAYSGVQTQISETDNGGHCSNWSQWPNN
jgi:hypothetical protein